MILQKLMLVSPDQIYNLFFSSYIYFTLVEPEARFELATCYLRNSYSTTELLRLVHISRWPSLALLLITLPCLPLPLFNPAYVEVNESQFGQIRRRLLSILFRQLPSIWSATNGICLVFKLVSDHPHKQHFSIYFLLR